MDFSSAIVLALRALGRNKMRSSLTMLGIIIGVGAVIAMVGVGQGAQQQVQQQIAAMGSNILFVGSGTVTRGGTHMGWGATKTLIYADMLAILRECPAVKAAAPGSNTSTQVVFGNDNWATRINGTEAQYLDNRNWPFQEGSVVGSDPAEDTQEMRSSVHLAALGRFHRSCVPHFKGAETDCSLGFGDACLEFPAVWLQNGFSVKHQPILISARIRHW